MGLGQTIALWSVLTVGMGPAGYAETVLWDRSTPEIIERGILVPDQEFTRERLVARSEQERKGTTATLVHLTILMEGQMEGQKSPMRLTQPSHVSFKSLLATRKRYATSDVHIAEMIGIGGDFVLRVRDGGKTWREVLAGKDPLLHSVEASEFEILHITYTVQIVAPLKAYVRVRGEVSLKAAEAFYERIRKLLPAADIFEQPVLVEIRGDTWFPAMPFPEMYWYEDFVVPADIGKIEDAPHMVCGWAIIDGSACQASVRGQ